MPVWLDGRKVDDAAEKELSALAAIVARQEETNRLLGMLMVGLTPLAPDMADLQEQGG